jgi:hypothetical protein
MSTEKCATCGKPLGDAHDAEMYRLAQVKRLVRLGKSLRDPATHDIRLLPEPELEKLARDKAPVTPERRDFEALLLEHVFLGPPYRAALTAWINKVTAKRLIGT